MTEKKKCCSACTGPYFTASESAVSCISEIRSFHFMKFTWEGRMRKKNSKEGGELLSSKISSLANCGSFLSQLTTLKQMINDSRSCSIIDTVW